MDTPQSPAQDDAQRLRTLLEINNAVLVSSGLDMGAPPLCLGEGSAEGLAGNDVVLHGQVCQTS